MEQLVRTMWERYTIKKKRGPDRSWQVQKMSGMERTAGGNTRRRAKDELELLRHSTDLRFGGGGAGGRGRGGCYRVKHTMR